MGNYSIAPDTLLERGRNLSEQYRNATPFPHIAIDDFFPPEVVETVLAQFPRPDSIDWQKFENARERKLASNNERLLPPAARQLIWEMNSQVFLQFLETLTGIPNLLPDPRLWGGGMHQIVRGGKLGVHVDFNKHQVFEIDRRINLLLYLNKDWKEEYGGHFELWDQDVKTCVRKILPVFNRVAIFSTSEHSWHGHPDPLNCPDGWSRKSLAMYYYTNGRPAEEQSDAHDTVFRERPGEVAAVEESPRIGLRDFLPPILTRAIRRLRGRADATPRR